MEQCATMPDIDQKRITGGHPDEQPPQRIDWRAILPPHQAADAYPLMSPKELDDLYEDINRDGLRVPIVLWEDPETGKVYLLDGRNRLDAVSDDDLAEFIRNVKKADIFEGPILAEFYEGDPWSAVISFNDQRRHMTKQERAAAIVKVRQAEQAHIEAKSAGAKYDSANLARSNLTPLKDRAGSKASPIPGQRGGSTKGVTGKAIEDGRKQGISERTIKRAVAEAAGKPEPVKAVIGTGTNLPAALNGALDKPESESAPQPANKEREELSLAGTVAFTQLVAECLSLSYAMRRKQVRRLANELGVKVTVNE